MRLEGNTVASINTTGANSIISAPFDLNLPAAPSPVITVVSVDGKPVNANPFHFPSSTINTSSVVPVVINATNVPVASKVTLYVFSDGQPDQAVAVTLTGSDTTSTASVPVLFPPGGSRGFVKAVFK